MEHRCKLAAKHGRLPVILVCDGDRKSELLPTDGHDMVPHDK
jgi:hypothetical protein